MKSPANLLLVVLLAIVGVKLSEQLYRFVAFRDERAQARVLQERLLDAGARVELARTEDRRMRTLLAEDDERLERERARLMRLQSGLEHEPASMAEYEQYRAALEAYNRHVVARNGRNREHQAFRERLLASVEEYVALGDSIRAVAAAMGEHYYSVPTPLEAAVARGVVRATP